MTKMLLLSNPVLSFSFYYWNAYGIITLEVQGFDEWSGLFVNYKISLHNPLAIMPNANHQKKFGQFFFSSISLVNDCICLAKSKRNS